MKKRSIFWLLLSNFIIVFPIYAEKIKFYEIYNLTTESFIYKSGSSEECRKVSTLPLMKKTTATFVFEDNQNINCIFNTKESPVCEVIIHFYPKSLLTFSPMKSCERFDFQPHARSQHIESLAIKFLAF